MTFFIWKVYLTYVTGSLKKYITIIMINNYIMQKYYSIASCLLLEETGAVIWAINFM